MNSKQVLFFATKSDIEQIIISIETSYPIKYYEMGLFDIESDKYFNTVLEVPDFGVAKSGDWNRDLRLMAIPKNLPMIIRPVNQRKGGIKYAIDPILNHISICFQFGGIYKEGILLAGTCFTTNLNDFSLQVFKDFSSKIKKSFKKIDMFYVGPEAEEKLREGWRLVQNEGFAKGYDLTLKG
ncbi:hypothetical protein LF887_16320 [Chryseobacterium sp. MEBOG06]|uniref:hypothetical protein n=1 Tax=Chryseobacterium sp. MEBOG06 TaxID=2879938 RepID=UPI001F3B96C1|nr:hypothetical protein [Chryseobacterium sp. MEBOG06]UKB82570.1 hypothetical protein LF887_16320 [Chryseobacterium sp. MEBOG06]